MDEITATIVTDLLLSVAQFAQNTVVSKDNFSWYENCTYSKMRPLERIYKNLIEFQKRCK